MSLQDFLGGGGTPYNQIRKISGEIGDASELVNAEKAERIAADSSLSERIDSKADLVGGVVPTSQIPAIALTKPFPVANRAAMLALTAEPGDVAVVASDTDGRRHTYMLQSAPASTFANWVLIDGPAAPVDSVNGQTGTVVLGYADVGAASTVDARLSDQRDPKDGSVTAAKLASGAVTPAALGITGSGARVPVQDGATQGTWGTSFQIASTATAGTLVRRDPTTGTVKAAQGTTTDDLVTRAQLDTKLASSASNSTAYVVNAAGAQGGVGYSSIPSNNTFLQRTSTSTAQAADPVVAADLGTKAYIDARTIPNVQIFTSNGTWTKPSVGTVVRVMGVGPGQGGASGARGAPGQILTGGAGGPGGGRFIAEFLLTDLPSTVPVVVPAGGLGAAAVTTDNTPGINATTVQPTSFGSTTVYARSNSGQSAAEGGKIGGTAAAGGGSGVGMFSGGSGGSSSAAGLGGGQGGSGPSAGGGGAGGGITAANVASAGGSGSVVFSSSNANSSGGIVGGSGPSTVVSIALPNTAMPGGGGGAGAASVTGAAQAGANGGIYGGGGGGGGASQNGFASGAGGNGAPGILIAITI